MKNDLLDKQHDDEFWETFFQLEKLADVPLDDDESLRIVARDPQTGAKNVYGGLRLKKMLRKAV